MFQYLKYLPLTKIIANHPNLVTLFNKIVEDVQPHIDEIQQAIAEAEVMIRQIHGEQT